MIARASGLGMGVGRISRLLRRVGVLAVRDEGLDTTRPVEYVSVIRQRTGVKRLLAPRVAVRVIIDRRCVADGVEVTR
jgi:hypothetical protein